MPASPRSTDPKLPPDVEALIAEAHGCPPIDPESLVDVARSAYLAGVRDERERAAKGDK